MAGDLVGYNQLYNTYTTTTGGYGTTACIGYPTTSWYTYSNCYQDKGEKAFRLLIALRDKKLVNLKTIDEFIDAMNLIMKEL